MGEGQVMHGMRLDDAYRVERVLAHGANGTTELVTIEGAGPFVRKRMPLSQARRSVWAMLGDARCDRLPHVQATYELPDEYVVVYDYVPGTSVAALVASEGRLEPARAAALAQDVCEAAGALHSLGIVHRDITATNVVVASDGAHLVDLGIARLRVEGATHDTTSLGTWGYSSPEQYGFAQTDARSDIYGIGRLLGYMLTGVEPGAEGFDAALADDALVPPALREVIAQACAFEPSARYQSAAQMAAALANARATLPTPKGEGRAAQAAREAEGAQAAPGPHARAEAPKAPEAKGTRPAKTKGGKGGGENRKGSPHSSSRRRRLVLDVVGVATALVVALVVSSAGLGGQTSSSSGMAGSNGNATSSEAEASVGNEGTLSNTGATASSGATTSTGASVSGVNPQDVLKIGDVDWGITSDGYFIYVLRFENASDIYSVARGTDGQVKLTGYDKDGGVTFTEDVNYPTLRPHQSVANAGDVLSYVGDTVRVEVNVGWSRVKLETLPEAEPTTLEVANVRARQDEYDYVPTFTGTLKVVADPGDGVWGTAQVEIVLRDADGKPCGFALDVFSMPAVGETVGFEALTYGSGSSYASYDVYPSAW